MKIIKAEKERIRINEEEDIRIETNIDACDIDALDINAENIDAWDINALDITARNIDAYDIDAWNINAWNIIQVRGTKLKANSIKAKLILIYNRNCKIEVKEPIKCKIIYMEDLKGEQEK